MKMYRDKNCLTTTLSTTSHIVCPGTEPSPEQWSSNYLPEPWHGRNSFVVAVEQENSSDKKIEHFPGSHHIHSTGSQHLYAMYGHP
jgi:hypothetical protein